MESAGVRYLRTRCFCIRNLTRSLRFAIKCFFSRVGWLWANDVSVPRKGARKVTSGLPGWIFFGRVLIWPGCFGEHILGLFGLYPSSLSKSVGFVSLSGKASLVLYICCYPISTVLACLFSVGVRISWKKLC